MSTSQNRSNKYKSTGYSWLIKHFGLQVMPHWHKSETGGSVHQKIIEPDGSIKEIFPKSYFSGKNHLDHFEFALKYEGLNLEILSEVFSLIDKDDLTAWITIKPQGQYTRRIWYLYEWITGEQLPIDNLEKGNYIDLLDTDQYFTTEAIMVRRQRIRDNMLGGPEFCPLIRKTETITDFEKSDLSSRCHNILAEYPEKLLKRAISYMYTKETKSSFAIEHITPNANRTERFTSMLHLAEKEDFITNESLIELQNQIVDPRYAEEGFRNDQNYVGETVAWQQEKIHYISPKPEDMESLMEGLISSHKRMDDSQILHPVIHAAAIAFGFVFMHPFGDGNGRIHRFLIHNILTRRKFSPEGFIFPISAAMLKNMDAYDTCLESFSKPLIPLIDYALDENGKMEIHNQTANHYRYPDMTIIAETLFHFIQVTIEKEMVTELDFLKNYDITKTAIQEIVDMPDQRIDLFIRFCLQNNGTVSNSKRKSHFSELTENEIEQMQTVVQEAYK